MLSKLTIEKSLASWWKRLLIWVVFFVLLQVITFQIISTIEVFQDFDFYFGFLTFSSINLILAIIPSLLIEHLRYSSGLKTFGFTFDKYALKLILLGFVFALIMVMLYYITALTLGYEIRINNSISNDFIIILLLILVQSSFEEILMRGTIFQTLVQRFNPIVPVLLISLVFSVMHFNNPGYSYMSSFVIFLAGVLFGVLYIKTYSLWLCISFHFFWNFLSAFVIGSPVSGINFEIEIMSVDRNNFDETAQFLLGGSFGIEEGFLPAIFLLFLIVISLIKLKPNPIITSILFKRKFEESKLLN